MAEFFSGTRVIKKLVVTGKTPNIKLECTISEEWVSIIHETARCGASVTCRLLRRIGLKQTEKKILDTHIKSSLGIKGFANLETQVKEQVSSEISWDLANEEERTVNFCSPEYGKYTAIQYQKIRIYKFKYQNNRFWHKDSWQESISEQTKYFHDDSKRIDLDPACKPPPKALTDYDGLMHVDLGETSMLVGFKKLKDGIEIDFNGNLFTCKEDADKPFQTDIPSDYIPESLKFLGQIDTDFCKASLSSVEIPPVNFCEKNPKNKVEVVAPKTGGLVPPHGGKGLVCALLHGSELEAEKEKAAGLKRIDVSNRAKGDLIMMGIGGFSPLDGFMNKADWKGVCENLQMADGTFWPIPITLDISSADAATINEGDEIALYAEWELMATMKVTDKYEMTDADKKWECEQVFMGEGEESVDGNFWKIAPEDHPGVIRVMNQSEFNIAGPVKVLSQSEYPDEYKGVYLTPSETRAIFKERNWKNVAALQLRNPMYRSLEYLAKIAIEVCDGVMIHSLIGNLKKGDIPADTRVKAIEILIENYFVKDNIINAGYPLDMRYAGPREGLLHATFRQNYGINNMLIGLDHAGVGEFYGLFEAQEIFDRIPTTGDAGKDLQCQPMKLAWTFYCHKCDGMASRRTCNHTRDDRVLLSSGRLRQSLSGGLDIIDHFGRDEVIDHMRKYYDSRTEKVYDRMDGILADDIA